MIFPVDVEGLFNSPEYILKQIYLWHKDKIFPVNSNRTDALAERQKRAWEIIQQPLYITVNLSHPTGPFLYTNEPTCQLWKVLLLYLIFRVLYLCQRVHLPTFTSDLTRLMNSPNLSQHTKPLRYVSTYFKDKEKPLKTIFMDTWIYSSTICENSRSISSVSQLLLSFQNYDSQKIGDGKIIIFLLTENSLHYCSQGNPKNKPVRCTLQRNHCLAIDNNFSLSASPLLCSLRGKRHMKQSTAECNAQ